MRALARIAALLALLLAGGPALAQSEGLGKHDTDQPIEINADSLEVQQERNLAIFRGNVDALQGGIRLKSRELRVWYRPDGGQGDKAGGADVTGNILRIDALGDVFISSPRETAQGDLGVYDVPNRTITLTGAVVLTRDRNVIRGTKLVLNLESGHSRIDAGGGGRVQGRFEPNRAGEKKP